MPTATYGDSAFSELNLGLDCIGLDLSSGDNKFDVSRINAPTPPGSPPENHCGQPDNADPSDWCLKIPKDVRDLIKDQLCPIPLPIPKFRALGAVARLNHLEKKSAGFSWSDAYGGSLLLTIRFNSTGHEILGTFGPIRRFHGEIDNGKLFIYLVPQIGCDGKLFTFPLAGFTANINISNVSNSIEGKLRAKIRAQVAEMVRKTLANSKTCEIPGISTVTSVANCLFQAVVTNLCGIDLDTGQPMLCGMDSNGQPIGHPPPDAFFTQFEISQGKATIAWADSVAHHAKIVVEGVDPGFAESDERLILRLSGGWSHGPICEIASQSAEPGTQLTLPLQILGIPLPDGLPLDIRIKMDSIDLTSTPKPRMVGKIERTFAGPEFGAGEHTDSDQGLTVRYRITVT